MRAVGIAFENIRKSYSGAPALREVNLGVAPGTFHAILGENGAGKSTLMRILAGEVRADGGVLRVNEREVTFLSPRDAKSEGIRLVHQNLSLIPALSVLENILLESLDQEDWREVEARYVEGAKEFRFAIPPGTIVRDLSLAERQWLEVFRAVHLGAKVLILDEPTALLTPLEGDRLLGKIKDQCACGMTVILITHKLREIFGYAEAVTVLCKGAVVGTHQVGDITTKQLAALMVKSRNAPKATPPVVPTPGRTDRPVLSCENLAISDAKGHHLLTDVNWSFRKGLIYGVAGVAGNGQTEFAQTVAGVRKAARGKVHWTESNPVVRYIPADRNGEATSPYLTLLENMVLRRYGQREVSSKGLIAWDRLRQFGEEMVGRFQVKLHSLDDSPDSLSGGNLQRLVLARELSDRADLIVAHNPTSGLDLHTAAFVRTKLQEAAQAGTAILLLSDDLEELIDLSNEVVVLYRGAMSEPLIGKEITLERLAELMIGHETRQQTGK